jgi:hypothetical protein
MQKLMLFVFLFCTMAQSIGQTPVYEAVLAFVHENVPINPVNGQFEISKRPDGFYICTNFYLADNTTKIADCQMIWDQESAQFKKPIYNDLSEYTFNKEKAIIERFSSLWDRRNFIRHLLYYGYSQWAKDTKVFLENQDNLSAKQLETLARAYSAEANDFIHPNQYGLEGGQSAAYPDAGYAKISKERVSGFKEAFDKGLLAWERIKSIEPNYTPNIIVDLDLKLANEYMHGYLTMLCIHEKELAEEYLQKANYKPPFIQYAKLLLDECEQHTLLFTNGDSDTYPLWYVQEKLGYRKDVRVINLSLLQTTWYQEMILDHYKLNSSIAFEMLHYINRRAFVFNGEERLNFDEWLKTYQSTVHEQVEKGINAEPYDEVPGEWMLSYASSELEVNGNYYAMAVQVFIYDLIESNKNKKIASTSYYTFQELGLTRYAGKSGMLYKLLDREPDAKFNAKAEKQVISILSKLKTTYFSANSQWNSQQRQGFLYLSYSMVHKNGPQIVQLAEQKLINQLQKNDIDAALAVSISVFYDQLDPKKKDVFLIEYTKTCERIITEFKLTPQTLYDDLDQFQYLISLYTGLNYREITYYNTQKYTWKGSAKLKLLLINKLSDLQQYATENNLIVSEKRISNLLDVLRFCQ